MPVTSVANGTGGTDYTVWPPGLDWISNPTVALSKYTTGSTSINQLIGPLTRTSAGLSDYSSGGDHPKAVAQSAQISGDITVQAKLLNYMACPAYVCYPNTIYFDQGKYLTGAYPGGKFLTVTKPAGEVWAIYGTSFAYGYISGSNKLFTNSLATATAATVSWIAGQICAQRASVDTDGYLSVPAFSLGSRYTVFKGMSGVVSIAVPTAGTVPNVGDLMYCSPDRLLVSSDKNATTLIFIGTCLAQDKTVSPFIFSYLPSDVSTIQGQSYDSVSESLNVNNKTFVLLSYNPANLVLLYTNYRKTVTGTVFDNVYGYEILYNTGVGVTPSLRVPDLCFDTIIPAPFDNLRIIWTQEDPTKQRLVPKMYRRTFTSAPVTGMIATGRVRSDLESFTLVGEKASMQYNSCDFAHGQAYEFSSLPFNNIRRRIGFIPDLPTRMLTFPCSALSCKYGIKDPSTGAFNVIPGYPAIAFTPIGALATGSWYGTMTAPAPTYIESDATAEIAIMGSLDGGAYVQQLVTDFTSSLQTSLPVYPFDIVRFSTLSDSGGAWAGNTGWRWGALPMPVLTWGAAPSATFNAAAGQVTLSSFTSVPYSVATGHGIITAYSGTVATSQLQLMCYRLDWIGLASDLQPVTRGNSITTGGATGCGTTILLPAVSFKPVTGSTTLRVIIYVQATPPHPYALGQINEYVIDIAVP